MKKLKVVLADDHAIVRMGIKSLLEMEKDLEVVGEAEDGAEAIRLVRELKPEVVVMDLMMPGVDGFTATKEIAATNPFVGIVLLTTFATSNGLAGALASGARGALLKSSAEDELAEAIRAVAAGKKYLSGEVRRQLKQDPPVPELTDRQLEVLTFMAKGSTSKEIANAIGIAVSSVNDHIEAIVGKVGATNRTEAVAIAIRKHLLKL